MLRKITKYTLYCIILFAVILTILFYVAKQTLPFSAPLVEKEAWQHEEIQLKNGGYYLGNNWFKQTQSGLYEMYLEGDAYERGVAYGRLASKQIEKQEAIFVDQIKEMIPSSFYRSLIHLGIAFFNRNMDQYIPQEFKEEIYGVSQSASSEYDDEVGPAYSRMLNYHAAHDIGHALVNMNLIGCTAFAVNNAFSEDSMLLVGRNFDFYTGEAFREDKIVAFYKPTKGIPFVMITWGGMCGVTSGMNLEGLTVTLNAAPSNAPTASKMPISLLAREILQYAGSIEEAVKIASQREIFVSESIFISSASDDAVCVIEKTPNGMGVKRFSKDKMICTNHFQSDSLHNLEINEKAINENATTKRYARVAELLNQKTQFNPQDFVEILRNTQGLNNENIGVGNELCVNQMLAHHSIVFQPETRRFWIATDPFLKEEYLCYDLNEVFSGGEVYRKNDLDISALNTQDTVLFANYQLYMAYKDSVKSFTKEGRLFKNTSGFIASNPAYFYVYELIGDNRKSAGSTDYAQYYKEALLKEIPNVSERRRIEKKNQ